MQREIYWCKECNSPYNDDTNKCSICNRKGRKLSPDLRPVFAKERALLEYFGINAYQKESVWTNSRTHIYYIDGEKKRLPPYKEFREEAEEIRKYIYSQKEKIEAYEKEIIDNYKKQFLSSNLYLKKLEDKAFKFTQEVAQKYRRRLFMVSFSGGKDSTVVSDVVRRALGRDNILHIFGDTGLEDENTHEYIMDFLNKYPGVPFFKAKSEQNFWDLVDHMGPPSRVMRWCCTIIKAGPITNLLQSLKDNEGNEQKVLTYYGIRHSESTQRADYNAVTVGAKIGRQVTASPIIEWLEFDVWGYILSNDVLFNYSYQLGYSRVGCWLCPLNSTWSDFLNSVHFKKENDEWQSKLVQFAKDIGKPDPEVYVKDRKWAARQGGSGLQNVWTGIDIKPCGEMDNTIEVNLTKPVNEDIIEFFKPLGKLNRDLSDPVKGEYIFQKNGNAGNNIRLLASEGSTNVRVQALDKEKSDDIHRYAKYQLNKFQTCIQCTACSTACPYDSIVVRVEHDVYEVDEDKCVNCNECVTHFGSTGCLVAKSLSSYGEDRKNNLERERNLSKDGLPNNVFQPLNMVN